MSERISHGVVHKVPTDLRKALTSDSAALAIWEDLTPLARNEWICWVTFVKKDETRKEHVKRTISELKEGMRRPCCRAPCGAAPARTKSGAFRPVTAAPPLIAAWLVRFRRGLNRPANEKGHEQ